ncbi:MAG: phosphoglycolate phosphatase [Bryobacteraceae bacterium]|nr:phosphoglycolate phosphatase [Bryobacteraceae bacterium]
MAVDLIIFDLDGTLADTKLDLANAVNATRAEFGLPPLPNEEVYSYVGNGAPVLIRRALGPQFSEEEIQRGLESFFVRYREHMLDHTQLYPGVAESLDRLSADGVKMAILTNKPVRFSQDIVQGLGIADHFFRVYGGNSFATKKPDPEGVYALLAEAGAPRENALMVGDSAVDVQTARNAGIAVCGVTYGFQPNTLAAEPPDILVDRFSDLADMVLADRHPKGVSRK